VRQEGLANELYKWQLVKKYRGRPDTSASDFYEEIRSIYLSNLVYHNAARVKNHIASTYPEEYRKCFIQLFDEDEDLNTRVQRFMNDVLSVYRKVEPVLNSHHDERTTSVFLAYHDPGNYALYKDSFYRKYCGLTGVSPKPTGEKYAHYMELISEFRDNYILTDKELVSLVSDSLRPDCYPDESHLILAQNILYVMLDKDKSMANESELISVLKTAASKNYAEAYFNILENLADKFGFTNDNPKLAFSVNRSDNKLSVTVNQRPVINTDSGNENIFRSSDRVWLLIPASRSDSLREHEHFIKLSGEDAFEKMQGENAAPCPAAFNIFSIKDDESILEAWYEAVKSELDHDTKSPFRKFHNSAFLDAVIDPDYRELLFKRVYGPDIPIMNLNTLLYGPPGTGKTYSTIDLAVRITAPEDYSPNNHRANRKVYEKLVQEGRIVFTTFHQSLSYEDFIEGIKPATNDSGNLTYSVEDGLFKRLAVNAAFEYVGGRPPEEDKSSAVQELLAEDIVNTEDKKKYVLIIDEINRGNVSQIFGELITLIEEDKRYGNEEGLSAILPYSKSKFFVTPNLYIIGTMNTADRSVEALDTALRRRFSFIEMTPQYDLDGMDNIISGYRISELLETLNQRIEKLMDRDHRIGHSYFLEIKNPSDLMSVFRNKIIPLLQEYFYGNYDKMGLVLGSRFIEKIADESVKFARYQADENDFAHKPVCRINEKSLREIAEFEKALAALMNK
jgi:5-methylcytosine-specific restriction protein B